MSYTRPNEAEIAARRAQLAPFDGWNERAFCQLVVWRGVPQSYLDLGSGTGAMVNMARKIGIEAYGVDVINGPEHWFITHDLNEPLGLLYNAVDALQCVPLATYPAGAFAHFDLITCLEVAEHLDPDSSPVLCDTIARHLAPGGILVFSAAPPGQAGEHHTNCRPPHEWRGLFHERGISYREDYTRQLAHLLGWVAGPASHWLAANVQVFDTAGGEIL